MTKRNAIVPVRPAMRAAVRAGFDPYNSQPTVASHYERYARMCGARLAVPAILKAQAE